MKKDICHANNNQKKAGVITSYSDRAQNKDIYQG